MIRYYTDIALSWPGDDVIQYLIYIGKQLLSMASGIDMHRVDCSVFLTQDNPEAVVLVIICHFLNFWKIIYPLSAWPQFRPRVWKHLRHFQC